QLLGVARNYGGVSKDVLFQRIKPSINHPAKCAFIRVRRSYPLNHAPIDCLHSMQGRFRLGNLHLTRCELPTSRPLLQPPAEECLAASIFSAHCLESAAA